MSPRGLAAALCVALAGAGCGAEEPAVEAREGIDRPTFVDVVVELREASRPPASDSAFQLRKAEILAEHGVTEEDLRAFIDAHEDVDYLKRLWTEVRDRLEATPDPPGEAGRST